MSKYIPSRFQLCLMFRNIYSSALIFFATLQSLTGQQFHFFDTALTDFCYSPVNDKIYAVRDGSRANGNAIVVIDPGTGEELENIPIGSEPTLIRVSENGRYLYIVLKGAPQIKCYDLINQQFVRSYALRAPGASDLITLPPDGTSFVYSLESPGTPGFDGIVIYDSSGMIRPNLIGPFVTGGDRLALSADGNTLWGIGHGYQLDAFNKYQITPQGLEEVGAFPNLINVSPWASASSVHYVTHQNNRIYLQNGQIFDVSTSTPSLLTTLPTGQNYGFYPSPMVPAIDEDIIYQVSLFNPSNPSQYAGAFLNRYDKNTFQLLDWVVMTDWNLFGVIHKVRSFGQGRVGIWGTYQDRPIFVLYNGTPCTTTNLSLKILSERVYACESDTITLTAEPGYSDYIWSNGMRGQTIQLVKGDFGVYDSTYYRVKMPDGCLSEPSNKVYPWLDSGTPEIWDVFELDDVHALCPGQVARIYPWCSPEAARVLCSTGDTLNAGGIFQTTVGGTYAFTALSLGGCRSNTVYLEIGELHPNDAPPEITPNGPLTFCSNAPTQLTALAAGNDFYLEWSNGNTGAAITPSSPGNYFVRKVYDDGCQSFPSDTVQININYPPPILPLEQGIDLLYVTLGSVTGDSVQWYLNGAPITGATNDSIVPGTPGFYTITNATNGCLSDQSPPFVFPQPPNFTLSATPNGAPVWSYTLIVSGLSNTGSYTIEWSTGSTDYILSGVPEGTYCVTVTDTYYGITTTKCVNIVLNSAIEVTLFPVLEGIPIELSAQVNNTPVALDTMMSNADGKALFTGLNQGNYYFRAIPTPGTQAANLYLPTYCYSTALWEDASVATLSGLTVEGNSSPVSIAMIPAQMLNGPGTISGLLTDGLILQAWANSGNSSSSGPPISGASIFLYSTFGQPIQHAYTNINGFYSFSGLSAGTYTVVVNLPGVPPITVTVVIAFGQWGHTINFFLVDGTLVSNATETTSIGWSVHPNPTNGWIRITTPQPVSILLRNVFGQLMSGTIQVADYTDIDMGSYPSGVYFIDVLDQNGHFSSQKLIRN